MSFPDWYRPERRRFDPNPGWDTTERFCFGLSEWLMELPSDQVVPRLVEAIADFDNHQLCTSAVYVLEPVVDLRWHEIGDAFVRAMAGSQPLRKAVTCSWFDDREVAEQLHALVGDDDRIGDEPAPDRPHWKQLPSAEPIRRTSRWVLIAALERARDAGLELLVDAALIEALGNPNGAVRVWPTHRCTPADPTEPSFFRCGVELASPERGRIVIECDLLVADVESQALETPGIVTSLLKGFLEGLPGLDDE